MCGGQNIREKKKKKEKETYGGKKKAKNYKSQFKNITTIFSQ